MAPGFVRLARLGPPPGGQMTRTTNSRIAGFTFLLYIAAGVTGMVLSSQATGGEGIAAQLATIARHATDVRITVVLEMVECMCALVLAVTLYALTREQDPDLAMLGLCCRVGEGVIAGAGLHRTLALLWLATSAGADAPGPGAANALGAYLLRGSVAPSAMFFAVGSTAFSWLFLRGRMIPVPLAWIGVVASMLLVAAMPLVAAGFLKGPLAGFIWLPMVAFEVPLALWLLIKGAAPPGHPRFAPASA